MLNLRAGELPEKLNITDPQRVFAVHQAYADAGADIITTNTFGANRLKYDNVEELVRAGVLPEDYDFEAHKELVPMQPGDVPVTYADTSALERDFGFKPQTSVREGLRRFSEWYKAYYG